MGINVYNNNEDQFSETMKALKQLPKVNAPDDFEFNLMIKITNGDLEPEAQEKRQSKLLWIFGPAAVVVTTVILFITLTKSGLDSQLSPLQNQGSIYAGKVGDTVITGKPMARFAPKPAIKRIEANRMQNPVQEPQIYTDPSLPMVGNYSTSPLTKEGSFRLDNLLKGAKTGNSLSGTWTAKNGVGDVIPEEFLIRAQKGATDRKAVQDSLKNLTDSLKLKKNVKK